MELRRLVVAEKSSYYTVSRGLNRHETLRTLPIVESVSLYTGVSHVLQSQM